jgi:hypothetical protein
VHMPAGSQATQATGIERQAMPCAVAGHLAQRNERETAPGKVWCVAGTFTACLGGTVQSVIGRKNALEQGRRRGRRSWKTASAIQKTAPLSA